MKNLDLIIESLHPLERQIIPHLKDNSTADQITTSTNMKDVEVMRALQWLESKDVLSLIQTKNETIEIDKNGKTYSNEGFPEKNFLKSILNTSLTLNKIKEKSNLDNNEIGFSLGFLKSKKLIEMGKEISITNEGKNFLKSNKKEDFLNRLPKSKHSLSKDEQLIFKELIDRKDIIKSELKKTYTVKLKDIGKQLLKSKLDTNLIDT